MAEYVERDKVLAKAAPVEGCFSDMVSAYDVASIPAADVVEVVHGRWFIVYDKETDAPIGHACSACKKFNQARNNYCPNCGAIMDGE